MEIIKNVDEVIALRIENKNLKKENLELKKNNINLFNENDRLIKLLYKIEDLFKNH